MSYCHTVLNRNFIVAKQKWSETADDLLMKAVAMYGRDWIAVSEFVKHGFSREQCRHRWCRVCKIYSRILLN